MAVTLRAICKYESVDVCFAIFMNSQKCPPEVSKTIVTAPPMRNFAKGDSGPRPAGAAALCATTSGEPGAPPRRRRASGESVKIDSIPSTINESDASCSAFVLRWRAAATARFRGEAGDRLSQYRMVGFEAGRGCSRDCFVSGLLLRSTH